ncbi:MAG: hypothetical protein U9O20_01940 [Patescibacteria group bacterium]|nr:hypothetical protein [Patescibacteria group bacterium]
MSTKIKKFWMEHDQKVLIVLVLILTAVVSFRAGQIDEKTKKSAEIDVSLNQLAAANPKQEKLLALGGAVARKGINVVVSGENTENIANDGTKKECVLVGSKNSNKYHQSTCRWAEQIKPENRVCFSSVEDAQNKGYKAAKCCNK